MEVLHCEDAQSAEQLWAGTKSFHGNPVGTWGGWGGRTGSTEEREAEEAGCRLAGTEGCCWWTCSGRLWCSGPRRAGSWDGPEVQESLGSWNKERSLNLTEKEEEESKTT